MSKPAALTLTAALAVLATSSSCVRLGALPASAPAREDDPTAEEAAIERREICVGSRIDSAGDLADVLYYRAVRTPKGQIAVGYYAFFSEERPWGNNCLTWTLLPAVALDLVYSRALFVAPGLQRALHGKGDVEGVRVFYDVVDGELRVDRAVADDGTHDEVELSRADLYALDPARVVVYSDVWSHQLGGKGARSKDDLAYLRCFKGDRIQPLPDTIAREFNAVEGRAGPAHVEAMGVPITPGRQRDIAKR